MKPGVSAENDEDRVCNYECLLQNKARFFFPVFARGKRVRKRI